MLLTAFVVCWVLYGLVAVALEYFNFCAPYPLLWPWYLGQSLWDEFQLKRMERQYPYRHRR